MLPMGVHHCDTKLGVSIQFAIGQGELILHRLVSSVSFVHTIEADKKNMPLGLYGDPDCL